MPANSSRQAGASASNIVTEPDVVFEDQHGPPSLPAGVTHRLEMRQRAAVAAVFVADRAHPGHVILETVPPQLGQRTLQPVGPSIQVDQHDSFEEPAGPGKLANRGRSASTAASRG